MNKRNYIITKSCKRSTVDRENNVNLSTEKISTKSSEETKFINREEHIKIVDSIETLIYNLFHKHSSVKLNNLKNLHHRFQNNYLNITDDCKWIERLMGILKSLIYSSNLQVQLNSMQLFGSFIIQLVNASLDKYNDIITNLLKPIITDPAVDIDVRCAAIESITASIFFNKSLDSLAIIEIMKSLENIFTITQNETSYFKLEITAIRCWGLLFTILPEHLLEDVSLSILCLLSDLLDNDSVDVRIRAGECLALIFEKMINEIRSNLFYNNYDSILNKMRNLSTDGCKARNKNDRAKQRHEFREIIQSIESYSIKILNFNIHLRVKTLTIPNRTKLFQYDFLQRILQNGFNKHLQFNDVIMKIFDFDHPFKTKSNNYINKRPKAIKQNNKINRLRNKPKVIVDKTR